METGRVVYRGDLISLLSSSDSPVRSASRSGVDPYASQIGWCLRAGLWEGGYMATTAIYSLMNGPK